MNCPRSKSFRAARLIFFCRLPCRVYIGSTVVEVFSAPIAKIPVKPVSVISLSIITVKVVTEIVSTVGIDGNLCERTFLTDVLFATGTGMIHNRIENAVTIVAVSVKPVSIEPFLVVTFLVVSGIIAFDAVFEVILIDLILKSDRRLTWNSTPSVRS
ncbi:MAG: hypothetical protein IJU71_02205 [Selenomonadaceae bacterium]|nr:hypothetical protein [Selenomonadaceae bacterium]